MILEHLNSRTTIPLRDGMVIGRTEGDQNYPDDSLLSRKHFKVGIDTSGVFIEDLSSKNKTKINSLEIKPGEKVYLKAGDLIEIGNQRFSFKPAQQLKHQQPKTHTAPKPKINLFGVVGAPVSDANDTSPLTWNLSAILSIPLALLAAPTLVFIDVCYALDIPYQAVGWMIFGGFIFPLCSFLLKNRFEFKIRLALISAAVCLIGLICNLTYGNTTRVSGRASLVRENANCGSVAMPLARILTGRETTEQFDSVCLGRRISQSLKKNPLLLCPNWKSEGPPACLEELLVELEKNAPLSGTLIALLGVPFIESVRKNNPPSELGLKLDILQIQSAILEHLSKNSSTEKMAHDGIQRMKEILDSIRPPFPEPEVSRLDTLRARFEKLQSIWSKS